MQYLLTEKEYTYLCISKKIVQKGSREVLQKLCTLVADHMPVAVPWNKEGNVLKPWGCILTAKKDHYCDLCPVQEECPHSDKQWSK